MAIVQEIFWYTELYNIRLSCHDLPGMWNMFADSVSHLHEGGKLQSLDDSLGFRNIMFECIWPFYFVLHMSYNAFLSLAPQIWLS